MKSIQPYKDVLECNIYVIPYTEQIIEISNVFTNFWSEESTQFSVYVIVVVNF